MVRVLVPLETGGNTLCVRHSFRKTSVLYQNAALAFKRGAVFVFGTAGGNYAILLCHPPWRGIQDAMKSKKYIPPYKVGEEAVNLRVKNSRMSV